LYQLSNYKLPFATINRPIGVYVQREQDFKKHREAVFCQLEYKYPDIDGRVYDVIINGMYKVQDKVIGAAKKKKTSGKGFRESPQYYSAIYRHDQKGIKSYMKGDNHFYWLHLPNKTGAYIIPEDVMCEYGLVKDIHDNHRDVIMTSLYPYIEDVSKYKTGWCNDHLYFYNNPDHIQRIYNLFIITR
jgi:hypothetical protein